MPSTISLCEARVEICLLQVEPLSTTNFLPRPCWDPTTVGEKQLFQQRRLIQYFKQTCGCICTFRVIVEAPAELCQNQSVEKMLGRRQVQVLSILNLSRSTRTQPRRKEENLQPFLIARHQLKFAFFKFSHLAP